MILVIDNYDSFVYNLARYVSQAGREAKVVRNDEITLAEVKNLQPEAIILSPGPCTPNEAGICVDLVKKFGGSIPILGVCLGHQCIGAAYGAKTLRAAAPVHGKATVLRHSAKGIFKDLPNPLKVGRYHSLIVKPQPGMPLVVTAKTSEGEIMALKHKTHPVYGVQFHPESVLTEEGMHMIENFLRLAARWHSSGLSTQRQTRQSNQQVA